MSQQEFKSNGEPKPRTAVEYEFGAYRLRSDELTLRFRGAVVPLTPKAVKTLIVLLENAGRFVSKDTLLESVWDGSIVEEANLTQHVYLLRRQFEATSNQALIETLPKRGYRFTLPVAKRDVGVAGERTRRPFATVAGGSLAAIVLILVAIRFGPAERQPPATPLAPNLSAAALQDDALGWYYWRGWTESDLKQSVHDFRLVVNAAPRNARGYAGEAIAYAKLADFWEGSPSGLVASLAAEKLSQRALKLDAASGLAHAARGFVEFDVDGDIGAADRDLAKAVSEAPDLAVAHLWYGAELLWQGNLRSARNELERAGNLDDSLPSVDYLLALDYYMSRDYQDAIAYARLDQGDAWTTEAKPLLLAAAHEGARQYVLALRDVKQLPSQPSASLAASGALAHVYASMGLSASAHRELASVEQLSARSKDHPFLVALAYCANGRKSEAFAWLSHLPRFDRALFALDPRLDPLRRDPRFVRWLHG